MNKKKTNKAVVIGPDNRPMNLYQYDSDANSSTLLKRNMSKVSDGIIAITSKKAVKQSIKRKLLMQKYTCEQNKMYKR